MSVEFDVRRQKAFDFSAEATKQLITLATGIIAFTVTFAKDFLGNVDPACKWLAVVAWFIYFLSISSGILTMYALSGQLEPGGEETNKPSIWEGAVPWSMRAQQVFFAVAVLITLIFGLLSLYYPAKPVPPTSPATISASPTPSPSSTAILPVK